MKKADISRLPGPVAYGVRHSNIVAIAQGMLRQLREMELHQRDAGWVHVGDLGPLEDQAIKLAVEVSKVAALHARHKSKATP
jgi:hypothetical protein